MFVYVLAWPWHYYKLTEVQNLKPVDNCIEVSVDSDLEPGAFVDEMLKSLWHIFQLKSCHCDTVRPTLKCIECRSKLYVQIQKFPLGVFLK